MNSTLLRSLYDFDLLSFIIVLDVNSIYAGCDEKAHRAVAVAGIVPTVGKHPAAGPPKQSLDGAPS